MTAFVDEQEPSHEDSLQQFAVRSRVKASEHAVTESTSCHARKWLVPGSGVSDSESGKPSWVVHGSHLRAQLQPSVHVPLGVASRRHLMP